MTGTTSQSGEYRAIQHYHSDSIAKILSAYPATVQATLEADFEIASDPAKLVANLLADLIKEYGNQIILSACGKIAVYLQEYGINCPNGVDESKIAFFLSKALLPFIEREFSDNESTIEIISKSVQSSMVYMLDQNISDKRPNGGRKRLRDRMILQIKRGQSAQHFGDYGIYIIYKAIINSISEISDQD